MSRFLSDLASYAAGFVSFLSQFNYSYWVYPVLALFGLGFFFFLVTDNK